MGPRSNDRGNTFARTSPIAVSLLQWGRDLTIAEIRVRCGLRAGRTGFNGAAI